METKEGEGSEFIIQLSSIMRSIINILHLYFSSLFYSFVSNGQSNTIDSLKKVLQTQREDTNKVNVLNGLALILADTVLDNKGGMQYAKNALSLSEEIHFQKGSGEAHITLGKVYYRQSKYPEALENFLAAKQNMETAEYKLGTALSYDWIGYVYITVGNYPESLKNFQVALRIYKEIGNKGRMARMYQLISGVHFFEGEKEEAVRINLEGLRIMEQIEIKREWRSPSSIMAKSI